MRLFSCCFGGQTKQPDTHRDLLWAPLPGETYGASSWEQPKPQQHWWQHGGRSGGGAGGARAKAFGEGALLEVAAPFAPANKQHPSRSGYDPFREAQKAAAPATRFPAAPAAATAPAAEGGWLAEPAWLRERALQEAERVRQEEEEQHHEKASLFSMSHSHHRSSSPPPARQQSPARQRQPRGGQSKKKQDGLLPRVPAFGEGALTKWH